MPSGALPPAVAEMAARGPRWAQWAAVLPRRHRDLLAEWALRPDGEPMCGHASVVWPVRTTDDTAAVLKLGFGDDESAGEHLALRRWSGNGAVRLLAADPLRRALLLERLRLEDLSGVDDLTACEVVGDLYRRLHVPALPKLRSLRAVLDRTVEDLAALPRDAALPRRLVDRATSLGRDLVADTATDRVVVHTDLHFGNVLAAERAPWLVIDPKPCNGDPHWEPAPLLWNRWDELDDGVGGGVRAGVRRRLDAVVDAAGLDADRARAMTVVRMIGEAAEELAQGPEADTERVTVCVTIAKAVQ